jgi:hypothetical protein
MHAVIHKRRLLGYTTHFLYQPYKYTIHFTVRDVVIIICFPSSRLYIFKLIHLGIARPCLHEGREFIKLAFQLCSHFSEFDHAHTSSYKVSHTDTDIHTHARNFKRRLRLNAAVCLFCNYACKGCPLDEYVKRVAVITSKSATNSYCSKIINCRSSWKRSHLVWKISNYHAYAEPPKPGEYIYSSLTLVTRWPKLRGSF